MATLSNIEVEIVEDDELELIGCVTDLATLECEREEIQQLVAQRKNKGAYVPLKLFHRNNALFVSDISSGLYCELQVEYRHLHPYLQRTKQWRQKRDEGKTIEKRNVAMKEGASIHLKKELEVHEKIEIPMLTLEDKWAIDLLNTYMQLARIKEGLIAREIKLFGNPFNCTATLTGIIDQLQYCSRDGDLIMLELKTRKSRSLPQEEQKRGHALQLMLYKLLLDSLTQGSINYLSILEGLGLKMTVPLSQGPIEYIHQCGLTSLMNWPHWPKEDPTCLSLSGLAHTISQLITGLELPPVSTLLLQYEHQHSSDIIGVELVVYDEVWARKELEKSLQYWLGERSASGVDIEDSWKCHYCQFAEVCVWRKRQIAEHSPVKKWPSIFSR